MFSSQSLKEHECLVPLTLLEVLQEDVMVYQPGMPYCLHGAFPVETDKPRLSRYYRPFILVVDDDRFIGELLFELLSDAGFRVHIAIDGNAAYEVACQEMPALILADIMMPVCDGRALATRLRHNPQTAAIPLALMSSARPRLPDLEGIPFLPKPFDIDDLIGFVERHIEQHYPHGDG